MSSTTVAFFGATGASPMLSRPHLESGLPRNCPCPHTPELRDQLTAQSIDASLLSNLTILEGNALDVPTVKRTLSASSPTSLPTYIVHGVGGAPKLQFNLCHPLHIAALDNPTICETAAQTLQTALREIYSETPVLKASSRS